MDLGREGQGRARARILSRVSRAYFGQEVHGCAEHDGHNQGLEAVEGGLRQAGQILIAKIEGRKGGDEQECGQGKSDEGGERSARSASAQTDIGRHLHHRGSGDGLADGQAGLIPPRSANLWCR